MMRLSANVLVFTASSFNKALTKAKNLCSESVKYTCVSSGIENKHGAWDSSNREEGVMGACSLDSSSICLSNQSLAEERVCVYASTKTLLVFCASIHRYNAKNKGIEIKWLQANLFQLLLQWFIRNCVCIMLEINVSCLCNDSKWQWSFQLRKFTYEYKISVRSCCAAWVVVVVACCWRQYLVTPPAVKGYLVEGSWLQRF